MALTQAQRDAIFAGIDLNAIDDFASNPDSLIEIMSNDDYKQGLKCGKLSLEQLNYLFLAGFLSTQKALAESRAYTDAQIDSKANFCNILASDSGQLLQYRPQPDGTCKIFYGVTPPANLQNQYVDPVNGDDSNAGTRASPLRTIARAMGNLPEKTRGNIHLIDNAVHYAPSSTRQSLHKDITLYPYGAATDAAQAAWDTDASGWPWFGWQNAPKFTVQFVYDNVRGVAEPGKMLGIGWLNEEGSTLTIYGGRLISPQQSNVTAVPYWQSCIGGSGTVIMYDSELVAEQFPIFGSTPSANPTHSLEAVSISGAAPIFELGSGGKMNTSVYVRTAGMQNPQGLLFSVGSQPSDFGARVAHRSTAVPVSPNFIANF